MKTPSTLLSHNKFRLPRRVSFFLASSLIVLTILTIGVFVVRASALLFWRTDGTSGTWTGTNWSNPASATGGTAWANGDDAEFSANTTLTFATATVGNVTVDNGVTVTVTQAGTLTLGGVRTFNIGTGSTLTWTSQPQSTAAGNEGAGIIKSGAGTLNWGAGPGTNARYDGGFTLNAGTVVVSGNNSLTSGVMTINGGTLQSSGSLTYTSSSVVVGGDFAFAGTGNDVWNQTVNLGASTRTITNNTTSTATRTFSNTISGGAGAGLTFAGTGGSGGIVLSGTNTYTGNTTINGGTLALSGTGSIANSPTIAIAGGATFDVSGLTTALTLASGQALKASGTTTTGTIVTTATNGLTTAANSPLQFTAFNGATAPLTLSGNGTLALQSGNPVTVTVANGGTPLGAGNYKLIAKGASGTVSGTPTSVTVNGNGIASGTAASLLNISGELFLHVVTLSSEPTVQASNVQFSNVTQNSMTVSWTNGNGTSRIVLANGTPITGAPVDGTSYSPGQQIPSGDFVIYVGNGNSFNTGNILPGGGTYYFAVFEFNGSGGSENYLTTNPALGNQSTPVATFVWNGSVSTDYQDQNNWTPARTSSIKTTSDIISFQNGVTDNVSNVPNPGETIGQLQVSNNTGVFLSTGLNSTLTISGGSGTDLTVASGSQLNIITGTGVLAISLNTGTTGSISGSMNFSGSISGVGPKLLAADAGGITFQSGSIFATNTGFSGNAFGTTNLGSIIFANGSTYIQNAGSDPFGATAPNSVVVFQTGSSYKHQSSSSPSFDGRTYANFFYNVPSTTVSAGSTGTVTMDNLTVTAGTLNIATTGTANINSTVIINPGATLGLTGSNIACNVAGNFSNSGTFNAGTSTVTFNGNNLLQSITGTETFKNLTINHTGTQSVTAAGSTLAVTGLLHVQSGTFTSATAYNNVQIDSGATLSLSGDITVSGNWTNNGTFIANNHTVTFNGTASQTISGSSPTAFATLAISNTGAANNNIVSLSQDISDTALNITNGIFDQGTTSSVTSGAVAVSSGATFRNFGTGDLTLSGNVSNSGTINFDGSGAGCGGADSILIRSSVNGTQRSWSGTGTFSLSDVDVKDQGGTAIITVFSGTNSGGNGTNWVFIGGCTGAGGQTYVWVGPSTDDSWTTPANWQATNSATPGRVPATNDVLIFDGSTRPTPTVSNVPTQTIAALRIINNAFPSFSTNGANTLTIDAGSGGLGFDVASLNITGSNALTIKLASGTLGSVSGTMTVSGGAHRLIGSAANTITFQNGSTFTTSTGFTGNAFGTGAAGDGAAGSVVFVNNAFYIHNAGSSPFGSSGNASVVVFQTGSTAKILNATNFQANGRTYADLIIGDGSAAITPSDSGTLNFQFDNLTVNSPSSGANSTLTFTGSASSAVTIQGNITSTGTGTGTASDVTLTAGSGGIIVNGSVVGNSATFSNSAGSRTITFGSNASVPNGTTLTLQRNLRVTNSGVLSVNGTLSAGASGYVIGSLLKPVSSSAAFEVGTDNGYSPVSLANINGSANFTVLAVNAYMNGLTNTNSAIQRYWTLTNGGITSADVTFQYVPGAPPTGDVSAGVSTNTLNAFRKSNSSITELTAASRTSNSVTIAGVSAFSDWTLANGGSQVTFARLRSFSAINTSRGNLLQWQTSYEVDNVGFNLYRMEGHNLVRVTPTMVAGSALLAGARTVLTAGMSYSWRDAKGLPDSEYYLEDVDLNGTRTMNGPVVPVPAESGKVSLERQAILLNELNNAQTSTPAAITAGPAAQFTHTAPAAQTSESNTSGKKATAKTLNATSASGSSGGTQNEQLAEQRAIASGQAVKIAVKQAGWYRVTQAELVAAGLPANVDPQMLQLYADGVEQPILVSGSNPKQFGADASIEFYGTGLDTSMTDTRTYWLVVGTQPGKRVNIQSAQVNQGNQSKGGTTTNTTSAGTTNGGSQIMMELPTQSYAYTVERKDRIIYFTALLNGDADNFFGALIGSWRTDQSLSLVDVDQLVSGPATLEIALQGVGNGSHQVKVSYNGIEMGTITWNGQERTVNQIQIPRPYLMEGNNNVTLEALGGSSDLSLVDYVRLTYYHTYRAESDALTFSSPYISPMMINGFTTGQVRVFDITDPNAVVQVDAFVHQKGTSYVVNVPEGNANRILMAVADTRVQHPASITANTPSNLTSSDNHADFVILTHPNFRDAVTPLADLRRSQGLETMVVNIEDVYDEFSYGAPSRDAIKDFFAYATHNWAKAPRYVLLVGDASTDPRNYLNTSHRDFVPTKLIDTSLLTTASDDALVDFNNDGIADISIGRLPAQTLDQAQKMIAKITGYVPGQSGTGVLLVADQNLGYDFEGATNAIHTLLPANIPVMTIDRGDLPPDQVRNEIIAAINQGPMIVNYAGHGSAQVWAASGILRSDDATALTNGNKVPFFVSMTCLNGLFEDAFTDSLAESLMKADGGGAVAVWASSGLTEPDPQAQMDQQLMRLLFSNGQSPMLGDAVRGAKQATTDLDVRRTWIFFGDPTMRIR